MSKERNKEDAMFLLAIHGFNHELPTVQRAVSFFCFPSPTPTEGNNAPVESGRIYFPLMLMSTGCLAPLAPMAIGGAASTLANSIFNVVIVVIHCKTRESTNKDYCCCCCCLN